MSAEQQPLEAPQIIEQPQAVTYSYVFPIWYDSRTSDTVIHHSIWNNYSIQNVFQGSSSLK